MSRILKLKFPVKCTFTSGTRDFTMTTTYLPDINFCWPNSGSGSTAHFYMYPMVPSQQRIYFCFMQIEADASAKQWINTSTGYVHNAYAPHSSVANLPFKPTPQTLNNGKAYVSIGSAPDTHKGYAWTDPVSGVVYYLSEWFVNYPNTTASVIGGGELNYNMILTYMFDDDDPNFEMWLSDSRLTGFISTLENDWTTLNTEDELPTRAHFPEMIEPEEPEPPTGLNIYIGDTKVSKVYIGDTNITAVYIGDKKI